MSRHRRPPLPRVMAVAVTTAADVGAAMVSPRGENVRIAVVPVLPAEGRRQIVDAAAVVALVRAWRPEAVAVHLPSRFPKLKVREAASIALSIGAVRGLMAGLGVEVVPLDPYWVQGVEDAEADRAVAIRRWPHLRAEFTSLPASVAQAAVLAQTARDPQGYYD